MGENNVEIESPRSIRNRLNKSIADIMEFSRNDDGELLLKEGRDY